MINIKDMISVTNRTRNLVVYKVPDLGIRREFQAGETKTVSFEELQRLSWTPGGTYLLENSLRINNNAEAIKELGLHCEPEYFFTAEDVKALLATGSYDELLDCLDFAPAGVIDLVKDIAIKTELNDVKKREIILQKTGLDITKAIEINRETATNVVEENKTRRVGAASAESTEAKEEGGAVRRVAPKYTIVK